MLKSTFCIPGMDCPTEEALVRQVLRPLKAVQGLDFDLPGRTLTVFHTDALDEIDRSLRSLELGSELSLSEPVEASKVDQPPQQDHGAQRSVLKVVLALNTVMFIVETVAGLWGDSSGLLADGLDMLADALVYGVALYAVGKGLEQERRAARFSGILQSILAILLIFEVGRRLLFHSEPGSTVMIVTSAVALVVNFCCMLLLAPRKDDAVHMNASWIFTSTDVLANAGTILSGVLVRWTGSRLPDLVIGIVVSALVLRGGLKIFKISSKPG